MREFTDLYIRLDQTTKTNRKLIAIESYFRQANEADAAWALYFLSGYKLKGLVKTMALRRWAAEVALIPTWLFDECYETVGDLAETIALVVDQRGPGPLPMTDLRPTKSTNDSATSEPSAADAASWSLDDWMKQVVQPLAVQLEFVQRCAVINAWQRLSTAERLVFNKLLTGSFRVGVSQTSVVRALAQAVGLEQGVLTHRLMGDWRPSREFFAALIDPDLRNSRLSQPYPFFLANAIEQSPKELGEPSQWQAEWKWDGIRTQVIRRSGKTFLWSRGEELLTDRFPDLRASFAKLPDGTVLDGEIVAYREGRILSFAKLQRRIGLKKLIRKVVCEVPVAFFAFDLLEVQGEDIREQPLEIRRERLVLLGREWAPTSQANFDEFRLSNEEFFPEPDNLKIPPLVPFDHWEELAAARAQCRSEMAEGIMLKRRDSPYRAGRPRGDWWKWKIDPYSIDAVLVYAERGHGRRAGLYSDYTFAIWQGEELVPFAKAYSGLTNAELKQVDAFVRLHTLERFGPMVKVQPELVFEIGFESIQASHRHKSGYAVRFPRILAWRHDKKPTDADHVDRIQALLRES